MMSSDEESDESHPLNPTTHKETKTREDVPKDQKNVISEASVRLNSSEDKKSEKLDESHPLMKYENQNLWETEP